MQQIELELRARPELVEMRGKLQNFRRTTWHQIIINIFFFLVQIGIAASFSEAVLAMAVSFMFAALQLYFAIKAWRHLVRIWESLAQIDEMILLDRAGLLR